MNKKKEIYNSTYDDTINCKGPYEFNYTVVVNKTIKYDHNSNQQLFNQCAFANVTFGKLEPSKIGGILIFHNCYFNNCTFTGIYASIITFHRCIFDNCTFNDNNIIRLEFDACKIDNVIMTDKSNIGLITINAFLGRYFQIGVFGYKDFKNQFLSYKEYFTIDRMIIDTDSFTYKRECYKFIHNLDIKNNKFFNDGFLPINIDSNIAKSNYKYLFDPTYNCILIDPLIKEIPKGKIDGYKLVRLYDTENYYIAKLSIPEDAKRSCSIGLKCRCDKATVTGIYPIILYDSSINPNIGFGLNKYLPINYYIKQILDNDIISIDDKEFVSPFSRDMVGKELTYKVGKEITEINFNDDRWIECTAGIHFFLSIKDLFSVYSTLIKEESN